VLPKGGGMSEVEAIKGCVVGDPRGFQTLYNLHKRRVYSFCFRMVNDAEEAEELTREVFLQLFREIVAFKGKLNLASQLHRLAADVVLARLRKRGLDETCVAPVEGVNRGTLEMCIGELPNRYKAIFLLHDVEGCGHKEIAELMDCSVEDSRSQLHQARMKLRHLLHKKKDNLQELTLTF
jgi:RNA polymerase sigma-70 factor, ECF subfamily